MSNSHRVHDFVFGKPKDPTDPRIFHKISLIAFFAWVGLGADGLSSSSYGPEESFKALTSQGHQSLALLLAVATALTVFIISSAYSKIIEVFPSGGGGYVVATKTLGSGAGLVSGSALIVDYILTIAISIASCTDALFSFLPPAFLHYKIFITLSLVVALTYLNIRGVKESTLVLTPIFLVFVITHVIVIGYGILSHTTGITGVARQTAGTIGTAWNSGTTWKLFVGFMFAYTMGAGTYTGIEAVSNSMNVLREPKVETGKRTMLYMSISLALTAGGILLCYLLWNVVEHPGKTLNAVLIENVARDWNASGPVFRGFVIVTLVSEAALLVAAAQAGFIDGPNVLSNMAVDGWFPKRFAHLSDTLVRMNGVLLMGGAAALILVGTEVVARRSVPGDADGGGSIVGTLVVMYSINVFIVFVLSQLGMCVHWIKARRRTRHWLRYFILNGVGLTLCATILTFTVWQKFTKGGYVTLLITLGFIAICVWIQAHYRKVSRLLRRLDMAFREIPEAATDPGLASPTDDAATAVLFVGSYGGFGIHTFFAIHKAWPRYYQRFIILSVGVVDTAHFKGVEEVENLERETENTIRKYIRLARGQGCYAIGDYKIGPDAVELMMEMARKIKKEYPQAVFFSGKLVFPTENMLTRMLHNQTAYAVQREMQFEGMTMIVLPVRAI
ncbi:MAG: APC family permease [Planctomycetes bacterium]|nr:APC family permease [Planctomycetota bacterium]